MQYIRVSQGMEEPKYGTKPLQFQGSRSTEDSKIVKQPLPLLGTQSVEPSINKDEINTGSMSCGI